MANDAVDDLLKQQRCGQGKQLGEEAGDKDFHQAELVLAEVRQHPGKAEAFTRRIGAPAHDQGPGLGTQARFELFQGNLLDPFGWID